MERIIRAKEKNDNKWQKGKETLKVMIEKKSARQKVDSKGMVEASNNTRHRVTTHVAKMCRHIGE